MHANAYLAITHEANPSALAAALRGIAMISLTVLIAAPAFAQQPTGLPDPAQPPLAAPAPLVAPNGTRQRLVPQHFDAQGRFVPSHYEAPKTLRFRGHFEQDAKQRENEKQRGYALPVPDYGDATPPPMRDKKIEGRE
jgi:hypothetical protein